MSKYIVGVWGQFGDGKQIADGQAVRTTIITDELKRRYGEANVITVNTNQWKKRPISFFLESLRMIQNSKIVAIAPADNGYKIFVPLLLLLNILFRKKLIHIVIGGFLPALLRKKPLYLKLENKFDIIFVQTSNILNDLESLGVKNVAISSNPKRLQTRLFTDLKIINEKHLKLCVFSRIYKDKGVEDAIEAVKICNNRLGGRFLKLDFYGLVPDTYKERLSELLNENKDILDYKGIIPYDQTVQYLKNYFLMLFPTFYYGEGFPGCVIDAYNSALPIIATDWLYNSDVILDGKTGILVPVKNPYALSDAILKLYNDRNLHFEMAYNCLNEADKYSPEIVLKSIFDYIDYNKK